MSLTKDEHRIRLGDSVVDVVGTTGLVNATWALVVDDREVARDDSGSSDLSLVGTLADGSTVEARVHQGAFGPTEVAVVHDGDEVTRYRGFVA